jgi:uncharacterized protein (TIGR02391 family)
MPDALLQCGFEAGIPQTITMLNGLIARLEERRLSFASDDAGRARAAFEELDLHPRIAEVSADLFRQGNYRNAVLDGYLALEDAVRQKSRCRDRDGATLMRYVFSRNSPVITFNDLADETAQSEQEGFMHLFEGAALALRNPRAHALVRDTPEDALDYLGFLSLLAKRLDRGTRRRDP